MDNPFIIVDSAFLSKVLEVIVFITKIIYSIQIDKISEVFKIYPWLRSINISLLINSTFIIFEGEEHLKDIVNIIEDIGYKMKLERFDEINIRREFKSFLTRDT